MNKMKLHSRRQVFQKYGGDLEIPYKDGKGKQKSTKFKIEKTLARINKYNTQPAIPFEIFDYNLRTKSRLGANCLVCNASENVEMQGSAGLRRAPPGPAPH